MRRRCTAAVLGGLCSLVLVLDLAPAAQANPPARGQYHLNAPNPGGASPAQPGQVPGDSGGSSSTLWIIVAAAAVAAVGTGVIYARGRKEPPASR
jgi:hypothetical protein